MNLHFNHSFDKIAADSLTQRFLVLVHLVEGSHYLKPNMNTCVQVQVHHETKTTRVRRATHTPYYNETFAFDFEQTFESFLDNVVTLTVMDTGGTFKSKKPLGVCQFDLGIVWDMPDHQIYHKWAKLTDPRNRMPFIKGYLKFDLHILGPGETLKIPTQLKRAEEGVEGNLLFGATGRNLEAQAKYIVKVYTGKHFLFKSDIALLNQGRNPSTNTSTYVSIVVTFANNTLSTDRKPYQISYQDSSIAWNDQFTFTEIFPPTFQRVKIELLQNKTISYTFHICLRDIATAVGLVKETIPVFGPTVVYVYTDENFYAGALRISVEVVPVSVSLLKLNVGTAEKSKAVALQEDKLWKEGEFILFMSVFEMGMIPKHLSSKDMSLMLSIGKESQVLDHIAASLSDDVYYNFDITNDKPCVHVKVKLPDLRRRLYLRNRLNRIEKGLKKKLDNAERKVFSKNEEKAKRALSEAVKNFVDQMQKFDTSCKNLKMDEKFIMKKIRRTFEDIQKELESQIIEIKGHEDKISSLRNHAKTLSKLTEESRMSFPNIFIYLLNKNRLVSTCKIHPRHIIYSDVVEERGLSCGEFNSLFFTEFKEASSKAKTSGDALGGRIDAYFWFGLSSQQEKCLEMLPLEEDVIEEMLSDETLPTEIRHRSGVVFQTRAHLYNAIIDLGHDVTGMSDPYVKVIAGSKSAISHTVKATVTPVWKETLVLPRIVRYRTRTKIQENQPTIVLELWDDDSYKSKSGEILAGLTSRLTKDVDELIGRVIVKPNVILRQGENGVTKLRTYPVYNGHVQVGEITAAVELVEVSEDNEEVEGLDKSDVNETDVNRNDVNETNEEKTKTNQITQNTEYSHIYKIPETLLPPVQAYIMEGLFWGLRDVKKIRAPSIAIKCGDAKLNSLVIRDYKKSQNFGQLSGMVQVSLTRYKTPLVIKLYQKKRNGYVYRGVCVHDNINDLFKNFIEEKTWKDNFDKRNLLLHEKAMSESKSSHHPSEVRINMDMQIVELERATRKKTRKYKYAFKCKKYLKQSGQKTLKAHQYFNSWLKLPERKKRLSFYSLPYLLISLVQVVFWTLKKTLLFAMYFVCGYERTKKMRANYYQMIEKEHTSTSKESNLYETLNISEDEVEEELEKPDWWTMYYNSVYNSGVAEKIQQIQRETEERRTIRLCKCCAIVPKIFQKTNNKIEAPREIMENPPELIVYRNELEKVPQFEQFTDVLRTFDFYYGKLFSDNKNTLEDLKVGTFKGNILFYPADNAHLVTTNGKPLSQGALTGTMDNEQVNVTIRVYIVRAYGLHPKDKDGKCDPYIILKTGSTEINDRDNYVTNQINPYFGRHFEIQGSFPRDHKLTLEIKDRDALSKDDFIGKTTIDLESRFYSQHRGGCGLARSYTPEWRDQLRPSQLLEELCDRHEIGYPVYFHRSVVVGSKEFSLPRGMDVDDVKEELALTALLNWHQVPLVGTHLVPQHIESRTLYSAESQGVSQGVLEMWVDLFATDYGWVPSPVNIALRTPVDYELRVIVWNTADVELMDDAYFTGEKHSDIYVKGWLQGKEDIQQTDIHYRSSQGEGFFNWRFIFQVRYFAAEALMVVTRKDEEYRVPPKLHMQVWDNDNFSPDDYIGTLVLDLCRMPRGARTAARCAADIISEATPTINLFQTRRCRGWWPFIVGGNGPDKHKLVGKLEAELQILTKQEAVQNPVGPGRKEPEALPVPVRPDRYDLNFLWTPYRVVLGVIKAHRGKFLLGGLILAVVLFGAIFIYAFPGYAAKWLLVGAL